MKGLSAGGIKRAHVEPASTASQAWLPTPLEAIEAEARGRQEAEHLLAEALAELQRVRQLLEGEKAR